jgi:hypothetical protein
LRPTNQDRCEFHELRAYGRPFFLSEFALKPLFNGGTGVGLMLPLTIGAADADGHRFWKGEQYCLVLLSNYARHPIVSERFIARRTIAAAGQPLVHPAHVDAASASDRD